MARDFSRLQNKPPGAIPFIRVVVRGAAYAFSLDAVIDFCGKAAVFHQTG